MLSLGLALRNISQRTSSSFVLFYCSLRSHLLHPLFEKSPLGGQCRPQQSAMWTIDEPLESRTSEPWC